MLMLVQLTRLRVSVPVLATIPPDDAQHDVVSEQRRHYQRCHTRYADVQRLGFTAWK